MAFVLFRMRLAKKNTEGQRFREIREIRVLLNLNQQTQVRLNKKYP